MNEPHNPAPPTPARPAAPSPAPPGRWASFLSLFKPLLLVVVGLLILGTAAVVSGRWLLLSENGARWALSMAPGVEVQGWRGALLGPKWQVQRLRVQWDGGKQWLLLEDLQIDGLERTFRPHRHAWIGLQIDSLKARSITVDTGPGSGKPPPLPDTLAWPLQLLLKKLQVDTLKVDALSPITALTLQDLQLDPRPEGRHQFKQLQLQWQDLVVEGAGGLASHPPFALQMQAGVQGPASAASQPAAAHWSASLQLQGELAQPQAQARLRAWTATVGKAAPSSNKPSATLDANAVLTPFKAWPLQALQLQTQGLDLAALQAAAPRTAISGTVDIDTRAADAPISARLNLRNQLPGRYNEGRLPLQQITGAIVGRLDQRDRLEFKELDLAFADDAGAAGRWQGSGHWQGSVLSLQSQVQNLQPHRLDGRAAAMKLSGPLQLTVQGLPSPDPAATGTTPAWQVQAKVDLQGLLQVAPQAVQLKAAATATAQRIELTSAEMRSGAASATAQALLQREGKGPWKLQTQGKLLDFDPVPWWAGEPGAAGAAWRKGPHRLNANWQLALQLPVEATQLPTLEMAQRLAGNGTLQVLDSQLAGVPLSMDAKLAYGAAPAARSLAQASAQAQVQAQLRLAGVSLDLDARGDPVGNGAQDRVQLQLKAEQLQQLAPLAALHPLLAEFLPQQGNASATLSVNGRWPSVRTEGQAQLSQLRLGSNRLANGSANWRLDSAGTEPLVLQLDLTGLQGTDPKQSGNPVVFTADHLRANLRGTLQSHRIEASGAVPLVPPESMVKFFGIAPQRGTRLQLLAQGAWQGNQGRGLAGGGRWRGTVEQLRLEPWDGGAKPTTPTGTAVAALSSAAASAPSPAAAKLNTAAAPRPGATPASAAASGVTGVQAAWLEGRELRGEIELDANGKLVAAKADAGRLSLGETFRMRWDDVLVDLRPAQPQLQLRADIEPASVVPLISRMQPGWGLRGDLMVSARLEVRAAERMDADLVVRRASGDVLVQTAEGLQPLGLSELHIKASAHDGLWQIEPLLRGKGLGELSGNLQVKARPEDRWPKPDAPLQGRIIARAADIGIWGVWVPVGWRLTGEVSGTAAVTGTFGKPQFTGVVAGSGLGVRNLLEGVNVSNGQVLIQLDGDTARIETFTLQGGDGNIRITGDATLNDKPAAQLQLVATRFRVLGRADRFIVTSGQAQLKLQAGQSRLEGQFNIDEGLIDAGSSDAPSLDSDVVFKGETDPSLLGSEDEATRKNRSSFSMALGLDLGKRLRLRGRGLDATLQGDLKITAPQGRLVVNGVIRTVGGTYAAYGQKLQIERGVLAFSGAVGNPRLDVLALRPNLDTRVGVSILGQALDPRVQLYSETSMSDSDKLSWLVLGRAPDGLGRSDTALLQRAAMALLSGEGEAPTDALLKSLGIDELSVSQSEGDVRETVISLGKQISSRWYVGYERGLNSATGTWQLIYRIAQRFTLRAQAGLDNSLDLLWSLRLQETPADADMRKSVVLPATKKK